MQWRLNGVNKKAYMDEQPKNEYDIFITFRDERHAEFKAIAGYQVGTAVVAVMTKEGETFIYPLDTVECIVHSVSE